MADDQSKRYARSALNAVRGVSAEADASTAGATLCYGQWRRYHLDVGTMFP
ncbi:hypothetical protein DFQ14_101539 [Halopolyspora algeriensis]|uniref:Uncharacterized protein n=1 Tax=Halopolyspora algeriensis TaxID=1500506 RepID=A0A368W3E0_9ACTN|nr:hypothetical protein DFQ14_101539 [Halopolyspora algeriensis]TQM48279.1 hypothetical protein FHU43_3245 [Halopolyspora algeriensis]